jgi:hypothetical protein
MTRRCRRKLFHRVIFTRALAVRVTEIRSITLFGWPWEQSSTSIWAPEHIQLFKEPTW